MNKYKHRSDFMDIAKGILIILVVIGHSGFSYSKYIYWFHMPAFLFISGYFYKEINGYKEFVAYTKRKIIKTLYPYTLSLIVFAILDYYIYPFRVTLKYIENLLFGGRLLQGSHGVFWFVTCLLGTQILFALLNMSKKSKKLMLIILFILYLVAHMESYYILTTKHSINVPLNFDVSLFSILFFGFGYYSKNIISNIFILEKAKIIFITLVANVFCVVLIYMDYSKKFSYLLDLKYSRYNHIILDICIPMLFIVTIILNSYYIRRVKMLQFVGQNSIWIMYMHIPINYYLSKYYTYNWLTFSIMGTTVPISVCIIYKIFTTTSRKTIIEYK